MTYIVLKAPLNSNRSTLLVCLCIYVHWCRGWMRPRVSGIAAEDSVTEASPTAESRSQATPKKNKWSENFDCGIGLWPGRLSSFSAIILRLGHLTCKIVSEMTYNVLSGTLNPTIPYREFWQQAASHVVRLLRIEWSLCCLHCSWRHY